MNVKGYNKAGVWSEISTEIKQCHVEDGHSHITPRMIIDATGESGKQLIGFVLLVFINEIGQDHIFHDEPHHARLETGRSWV